MYEYKPYTKKTDVWGLGLILHEMCGLKKTFFCNDVQELTKKTIFENHNTLASCYSQELNRLVNMLLNKNSDLRPNVVNILKMPLIKEPALDLLKKYRQYKTIC